MHLGLTSCSYSRTSQFLVSELLSHSRILCLPPLPKNLQVIVFFHFSSSESVWWHLLPDMLALSVSQTPRPSLPQGLCTSCSLD